MRWLAVLLSAASCHLLAADTTLRPELRYLHKFGGSGGDAGDAVAVDSAGNIYIAGDTRSTDFPLKNPLQSHMAWTPLRVSSDGGKTWSSPAIPETVNAVAGSAKAPGVLYAGTDTRIYKSNDGGKTWSVLQAPVSGAVGGLAVDPQTPANVYAAAGSQIVVSRDSGVTWTVGWQYSGAPTSVLTSSVIVDSGRPSTLFATFGETVLRSTDSGSTWNPLANPPDGLYALSCDPTNPDVLYAAIDRPSAEADLGVVYKSTDGGNTWEQLSILNLAGPASPFAVTSTAVYAATGNGVFRSLDGGTTWTATGLTAPTGNVVVDPANPQLLYAAAESIYSSSDGGATWTISLGVRQPVRSLSIVTGSPSAVFVGAFVGQSGFVTKWSADGTQMIYSTYLGGSYYDYPTGIAVDHQGNAYVAGYTYSTDFPMTRGALQSTLTAPYAIFLAKLGPDGSTLAYSTFLGGSTGDAAMALAVDGSGNVYLTGYAGSSDFPVTAGPLATPSVRKCAATNPSAQDLAYAFVSKVDTVAGKLVYSTLLGGSCGNQGFGIRVDGAGSAYVAGATNSTDFPVTAGTLQQATASGVTTGFLAKLSPQGTGLPFATYLGGRYGSTANDVDLDAKGNLYVTGCSSGFDEQVFQSGFPVGILVGGSGPSLPSPGIDASCDGAAFAAKLDPAASSKTWVNYLGGETGQGGFVSADPGGNVWLAGFEMAYAFTPFPLVHPFQANGDGFVAQVSADGSTLRFSSQMDSANGLAVDSSGNAFLTGYAFGAALTSSSASLIRVDDAVPSAVDISPPKSVPPPDFLDWDDSVAAGEIVTISGSGLGPDQEVDAQIGADGRLAFSLAGTSVTFGGVPAPLLSVQAEQVTCIVPFAFSSDPNVLYTVQVKSAAGTSNSIILPLDFIMMELLAVANQDGSANSPDHPAAPGSIITIYGAGFGVTSSYPIDGSITGVSTPLQELNQFQMQFDDTPADILYAGSAPGQVAGIVQINVRVPQIAIGDHSAMLILQNSYGGGASSSIQVSVGK